MSNGFESITDEVIGFGLRLDGKADGQGNLTMPNGFVESSFYVSAGPSNALMAAHAGPYGVVHENSDKNVYVKNYLIPSWIGSNEAKIGGKQLGRNTFPVKFASGRVWVVSHDTMLPNQSTVSITAKRFGHFGSSVPASTHVKTIAIANAGNWGANGGWYVNDVSKTGEKRIYGLGFFGKSAIGWMELSITELSETELSYSFSTLKVLNEGQGAFVESYTNTGYENWITYLPEDLISTDVLVDPDTRLLTQSYNNLDTPRGGVGVPFVPRNASVEGSITGRVVTMLYNATGGIDEYLSTIKMTRARTASINDYSISSTSTEKTLSKALDGHWREVDVSPMSWTGAWSMTIEDNSALLVRIDGPNGSVEYTATSSYTKTADGYRAGTITATPYGGVPGAFTFHQYLTQTGGTATTTSYTASIGGIPSTAPTSNPYNTPSDTPNVFYRTPFSYLGDTITLAVFPDTLTTEAEKRQFLEQRASSVGTGIYHGAVAQVRQYSNSAFSVVGGYIQGANSDAHESPIMTRFGPSGSATQIGVTKLTSELHLKFEEFSLSAHPLTGEIFRRSGEHPFMGWV